MYNRQRSFTLICFLSLFLYRGLAQSNATADSIHTLVVFFDGLRPDYITPETMPNVFAFSQRGAYGKQHHSVFPTVTRVNASSYATGSYPAKNGLMGNTIYFPEVDKTKGLNTGEASELNRVTVATHGQLLTSVSIGELLAAAGKQMMVFSSGSTGSTLLQNHTMSGGITINPDMILPASFKQQLVTEIGEIPAADKAKDKQNVWVTDAIIRYALKADGPMLSSIWYTNPDHTAHSEGIGSVPAMASIKAADEQFGRIIDDLQKKGLTNSFNIIITADHGFVSHKGTNGVADFLIQQGLKKNKESEDVVIAEGAIYVKDHNEAVITSIVTALQAQPWVGSIFTKAATPGGNTGWVNGTVSFDAIHWNHPQRAADILVSYNWDDDKNAAGYAGYSYSRGVAGHGNFSPYEVHIALLAAGPSFRKNFSSELPTSNVDIVPTILHIHHLAVPTNMDGRVMVELLRETGSKQNDRPIKEIIKTSAKIKGGLYEMEVYRTKLGKYIYIDYS
ncbi:MAG TPA: alkaline phosphatase family protein, partial [Chitinophagaceae bacterium]|nr:alkaline phosphatase family protein [Chitinophagaceae bacterium]